MKRCWIFKVLLIVMVSIPIAPAAADVPDGAEWIVRHLSIAGGSDGVRLSAQVAVPRGGAGRPVPAVLLVTGNGPHTREQVISGNPMFRMMADDLACRGIAVMTCDPRGHGYSTGPGEMETTAADRTRDARACLDALRRQPEVDPARVGIVGHSEGAMIALMAAAEDDRVAFAGLLGVPGEPCGQIWIEQKVASLTQRGASPETAAAVRVAFQRFVGLAARGFESDAAYYAAGKDVLRAHGVKEEEITDQFVDKIVSDLRTPHMRYFLGWDPADYLPRVRVPLLAAWGDLDAQVSPARNAPLYERAAADNPKVTVKVLPREDHFFLTRPGHNPGDKHAYGRMHVSPALLDLLGEWIRSVSR